MLMLMLFYVSLMLLMPPPRARCLRRHACLSFHAMHVTSRYAHATSPLAMPIAACRFRALRALIFSVNTLIDADFLHELSISLLPRCFDYIRARC